jgi:hypothetical protein
MTELKTKKNPGNVIDFLNKVQDPQKYKDSLALLQLFEEITGEKATMWGGSIVWFGEYRYESPATGRSGQWPITGFSPRKQNLTVYIMLGFVPYTDLMKDLGKYKTGSSCLYFKKLEDIDLKSLKKLIERSYLDMKTKYS